MTGSNHLFEVNSAINQSAIPPKKIHYLFSQLRNPQAVLACRGNYFC